MNSSIFKGGFPACHVFFHVTGVFKRDRGLVSALSWTLGQAEVMVDLGCGGSPMDWKPTNNICIISGWW
jgi:hypothetical protein